MYHNTLNHEGETLREYQAKAGSQDEKILKYMKSFSYGTLFAPSKLHADMVAAKKISQYTPLTSIRRSLTGLTLSGALIKTDVTSTSLYNRPEHSWRLADPIQLELV